MADQIPVERDNEESLPIRLRDDLARLSPFVQVPNSIDAAILSRAKADYARRARLRLTIRWASTIAAAAAVLMIVLFVRMALVHPGKPLAVGDGKPEVAPRPLPGDINGDGKVDMLDAYILARRLASGAKLDRTWDVNGDGVLDQRDVDWIANESVALQSGILKSEIPNSSNGGAAQ